MTTPFMPTTDWGQVWRDIQSQKRQEYPRTPGHWDKRADEFTRAATKGDYVLQFIDILRPQPEWSILDIGCAAGTLAVPLAPQVARITAMDPSTRMRELLDQRCRNDGIDNIRIVDGRWEDDWEALGLKPHSVTMASRSVLTEDLGSAVRKLCDYATHRCVLSSLVDDGPHDRAIIESTGRTFLPGADYIVVYNFLRQVGIHANVMFTHTLEEKNYAHMDEAVAKLSWMVPGMTPEEEAGLRRHLEATLVRDDGRLHLPYVKHTRWAVMWWDKDMELDCDG